MENKEAYKKLIGLLAGYKKIILIISGCLILSTVLNLYIPLLSKGIMDYGFIGKDKVLLVKMAVLSVVIYLIISLIEIIKEKKRIEISTQLEYSLTLHSFQHLLRLKKEYFNKKNYAEILSVINTDIANIISIADQGMFFLITQIFSILGGIIGLFIINYKLTLLVLVYIPCKYFIMKYFAKKIKNNMNELITEMQNYSRWFGDTVGGVLEVKLFNLIHIKTEEFQQKQNSVLHNKKKFNMLNAWNAMIDSMLIQFLVMIIYVIGAELVFNLELSVGSIFAFVTYSTYVTSPISGMLNIGYLLSRILPSTKRFYKFMELPEEENINTLDHHPSFGDLELKDIVFLYDDSKFTLKNINMKFFKGSKVALIGKNGTGKSTIIDLITRMYIPEQGKILLDNQEISSFSLFEYRNMISVVSQKIYFFNDSIRNNILLYKEVKESEIMQAVTDSGLEEFIDEVTLDYIVGHNGSLLSGGQRQKIAMARALIHDKPIIILDEATAHTDAYSETQINSLLNTRLKAKTVIIITHKQKVLRNVDSIYVLGENSVLHGTYDELQHKTKTF